MIDQGGGRGDAGPQDADARTAAPRGKRLAIAIAAVVVVLLATLIFRIHQHAREAAMRGKDGGPGGAIAVAVATVARGDIPVRIPALGAITPLATVVVKTQISGQLQRIAFREGQMVRAGDFLAQIDPRPYEAALNLAKAAVDRDSALLANARLDLARYVGLIAENAIAEQQLDTQRALVKQYEGAVLGDRAQIRTAELNLQYAHIVSPIGGRVGLRQVDAGNYVTPGDANGIVVITQLQPISAIFSIPEDNVNSIERRLHEGATLEVDAYDRSDSTKLAAGRLVTIDNQIDASTGTFKLRALFDNKDGRLFPNQFVNIRLLEQILHDQTLIPSAAVRRGAPRGVATTVVYLVKADRTVAVRPVVLGVSAGDVVAVTSGLEPGNVVVTEGGDRLRAGSAVRLPGAPSRRPGEPRARSR